MVSSNAVTEPPPVNILGDEGERSIAASSMNRTMRTESALYLDSLLEIGLLAFECLADKKNNLLTLLTIWTLVPSPRHFMIVSPLNSLRTSSTHGSVNCLRIPEIHTLAEERQKLFATGVNCRRTVS
jgi:hypothetical protein